MADSKTVFEGITKLDNVQYPVLVPNMQGLMASIESGANEVAIFISASEEFSKKNINCKNT
jgi:hydroxymethylglutaryl-CoA lyase